MYVQTYALDAQGPAFQIKVIGVLCLCLQEKPKGSPFFVGSANERKSSSDAPKAGPDNNFRGNSPQKPCRVESKGLVQKVPMRSCLKELRLQGFVLLKKAPLFSSGQPDFV